MSTITDMCSRCRGFGFVCGMGGAPDICLACGCAGVVWPPYCSRCGSFGRMGEPCKRCVRLAAVRMEESAPAEALTSPAGSGAQRSDVRVSGAEKDTA